MSGPYITDAGTFLVSTFFGLYILAVLLRFLFQLVRADFYNPISQFLVKITNPPLRPLRSWVPGIGGVDLPSVVLMLGLKMLEMWLVALIGGYATGFGGLLVLAIAGLLQLVLHVFLFAILIQVILSWFAPGSYNYMTSLLHSLTEPLLHPARRLLPPIAGLDLSPLVVLIILQLLSMLLIAPLRDLGSALLLA